MLYVCVAALNGLDHTRRLVAALTDVTTVPLRLVLIDNGSTDGTPQEWANRIPAVQLICNEGNLGASTAWNQGIRFALDNNAEAVLVAGNDTVPMPGTIERLYALLQRGLPFVTGTAVPYDTPPAPIANEDASQPLLAAPDFSFFMVRPQVVMEAVGRWDAAVEFARRKQHELSGSTEPLPFLSNPWEWGLFDSRYRLGYVNDNDYHWRACNAGIPCLRDPQALFRHDTSLTIRVNPEVGQQNQEAFRQNIELFRWKWGGLPHELANPVQSARPLNVTDEQWQQMTGGRPVQEIDRAQAVEQARRVYAQYGVAA